MSARRWFRLRRWLTAPWRRERLLDKLFRMSTAANYRAMDHVGDEWLWLESLHRSGVLFERWKRVFWRKPLGYYEHRPKGE